MTNPFQQPVDIWRISFELKYKNIASFEEVFEETTLAISSHEISSNTIEAMPDDPWAIELYFDHPISKDIVPSNLLEYLDAKTLKVERVENKDWVADAANSLHDVKTKRFHIIRRAGEGDKNLIPIIINITRAFGTGEHATTMGCLEAMEAHAATPLKSILDIGTGAGILAICSKKLWTDSFVMGTDIDPVALEVATQHADLNDVDIEFAEFPDKSVKYDMIVANILARPLIDMAFDVSQMLSSSGMVILSGFLENQLRDVVSEYEKYGLLTESVVNKNNWIILSLRK